MRTIFSQYWICVPPQLQHSCLNSTPALLLFPLQGGGGWLGVRGDGAVESALCFYKLVVPSGFASLAPYHLLLFKSTEQDWHEVLALLRRIIRDGDRELQNNTNHMVCFGTELCPVVSLGSVKFSGLSMSCEREKGALCVCGKDGSGGGGGGRGWAHLQVQRSHTLMQPSSIFNQPSLMSILEPLPNS